MLTNQFGTSSPSASWRRSVCCLCSLCRSACRRQPPTRRARSEAFEAERSSNARGGVGDSPHAHLVDAAPSPERSPTAGRSRTMTFSVTTLTVGRSTVRRALSSSASTASGADTGRSSRNEGVRRSSWARSGGGFDGTVHHPTRLHHLLSMTGTVSRSTSGQPEPGATGRHESISKDRCSRTSVRRPQSWSLHRLWGYR